jgi:hypothetical protein
LIPYAKSFISIIDIKIFFKITGGTIHMLLINV